MILSYTGRSELSHVIEPSEVPSDDLAMDGPPFHLCVRLLYIASCKGLHAPPTNNSIFRLCTHNTILTSPGIRTWFRSL